MLLVSFILLSVQLVPSGGLPACFVIVPACLVITCYDLVVEATYRRVAHYRVSWPAACTPGKPALQNMALTLVFALLLETEQKRLR